MRPPGRIPRQSHRADGASAMETTNGWSCRHDRGDPGTPGAEARRFEVGLATLERVGSRVGKPGMPVGLSGGGAWPSLRGEEHLVDRTLRNVVHGRFERSLSGMCAAAALLTTAEIYIEHYRASFADPLMWTPILVTPPVVVAGVAGVLSRRWAKTALPVSAAIYTLNGLAGGYLHARGISRRPGGWHEASYNVPMGPPLLAPGLMCLVGGMGLLAAIMRREW